MGSTADPPVSSLCQPKRPKQKMAAPAPANLFVIFVPSRAGAEKGATKNGPNVGRIDESGAATKASRKPAVRASVFDPSKNHEPLARRPFSFSEKFPLRASRARLRLALRRSLQLFPKKRKVGGHFQKLHWLVSGCHLPVPGTRFKKTETKGGERPNTQRPPSERRCQTNAKAAQRTGGDPLGGTSLFQNPKRRGPLQI